MKYKIRCLDCRYDDENEMLVVLVFCEDFGEQRIFTIPQSDFHYKIPNTPAPAAEMIKMAHIMKGKRFVWDLRDDPNKTPLPEDDSEIAKMYKEHLEGELNEISEGLLDTDRRTVMRLAEVVEKDRDRKAKHPPTEQDIMDELMMRERLRGKGV